MRSIHIDHGNPMNALLETPFTKRISELGLSLKRPKDIIILSAHSINENTLLEIDSNPTPPMIYDMYGFPPELYEVDYPVNNDIALGKEISEILGKSGIHNIFNTTRGIDHGIWSVLIHLFPDATIPIVPLSLQYYEDVEFHFFLGEVLASHIGDDTLFISSGNIVHNLRLLDWENSRTPDWASDFDTGVYDITQSAHYESILSYEQMAGARFAVPTPDHFSPFVTFLGSSRGKMVQSLSQGFELGSISTRIYANF